MTRSCEHVMSIEPKDFSTFVESMRSWTLLWVRPGAITDEQRKKSLPGQRSAFAKKDLKAGHVLIRQDFDLLRPGGGLISPLNYDFFLGRKLSSDKKAGSMFVEGDIV